MLKDEHGASAVEFAIILPLLFVLMFGIIEFSLLMYNKAMITNASREGARAGIVFKWDAANDVYVPPTDADIAQVVDSYLDSNLISFSPATEQVDVTYEDTNSSSALDSGDYRIVEVSYPYTFLLVPSLRKLLVPGPKSGSINLVARTTMRME